MSGVDAPAPWRIQFDNARDPYTARNALGAEKIGGGGGAPTSAEYIVSATDPTLTAERVLTNTATITWDFTTPGQAKASTAAGGGNVSNSGTPTLGQYAKWVTATTIQGVSAATVLGDIGAQPLDGDLTSLAAAAGTNTIYYRSAANTWAAVTIGANLTFTGGTLSAAAGGGGDVFLAANNPFTGSNTFASSGRTAFGHTALIGAANVEVHGSSTATAGIELTSWAGAIAGGQPIVILQKTRAATVGGTRVAIATGDNLGSLQFRGDDGTTFRSAAQINVAADGVFFGSGLPGRILVFTASAAGTLTERMRIDSAGVVTVGPNATPYVRMSATENAIIGVTNGSNAAAGVVGEYLETAASGYVGCAQNAVTTVHSIALTAGDWDVWGGFLSSSGITGYSGNQWSIGPTAATLNTKAGCLNFGVTSGSGIIHAVIGVQRISLAAAATYYFNFYTDAATGANISAILSARRRR